MGVIQEAWQAVWRRRDLRPIYEWARDNIDLKAPLTITGPFDVSRSRHFIGPLDSLQDDHVREENVLKPVRGGGTLIADVWLPWTRSNDPGPCMFVLQTDPIADDHFSKVLLPTLESVPEIRRMLESLDRHAVTSKKIEFADGNHIHINGPSIGNLQTNAFRYVVEDECWLYPPGRMADAEGRVGDFVKLETSKILRVSQGGPQERLELHECAWHRAYNNAAIYEWQVNCPHCQKAYDPVFSGTREDGSFWGVTWDRHKLPNGDWHIDKCAATVRFECPHCAVPVLDSARTKAEWNRTGSYRLTNGENRKRKSHHWETVIDYPWDELTVLWLDACNAERRGDLRPKLQFYQKRRAMFKDEASLLRGGLNLRRVAYEINSADQLPDEVGRCMTIDRQEEELFWYTVRAWLTGGRSRRIAFGKLYGFGAVEAMREKWKVPKNNTLIDSGYLPKGDQGVYAACIKFGWIALKGDKATEFQHRLRSGKVVLKSYAPLAFGDPGMGTGTQGRRYCNLIRFSKYQMNQLIQGLIDRGLWEEPQVEEDPEMGKEYNAQMAARVKITEYITKTGEQRTFYKESANDHARDLANGQGVYAVLADHVSDPAAERMTKTEAAKAESVS